MIPVAAAALGATLAALVVRWEPLANGSGIQHVEAVYRGQAPPPRIRLLPAKFIGGVLAIGSGLVLGREGPTVHMGAAIGAQAARNARLPDSEVRMMQTALGGAGLAVAFNAPISGTLFTLEGDPVISGQDRAGDRVRCGGGGRMLPAGPGRSCGFQMEDIDEPELVWLPLFVVFGLLTGVLGALYNWMILWLLDHVHAVRRIPTVFKATVIGAIIGLVMLIYPRAVGGGSR